MAVQNDKVSEKRRRLFKALSAVPVVTTLRPGSALAAQSSMQCAAKNRAEYPDPETGPGPGTDPLLRAPLTYWILTDADVRKVAVGPFPDLQSRGIDIVESDLPMTIVQITADDTLNFPDSPPGLYELDGSLFTDRFSGLANATVDAGGNLVIEEEVGTTTQVLTTLAPLTGSFLVVITTGEKIINGDTVEDAQIETMGLWPEEQFMPGTSGSPLGPGSPQGITATCLNSFVDAGNGASRGLTGG